MFCLQAGPCVTCGRYPLRRPRSRSSLGAGLVVLWGGRHFSVGTSRASIPDSVAHLHHNRVVPFVYVAHIADLRVVWSDWYPRKYSSDPL